MVSLYSIDPINVEGRKTLISLKQRCSIMNTALNPSDASYQVYPRILENFPALMNSSFLLPINWI